MKYKRLAGAFATSLLAFATPAQAELIGAGNVQTIAQIIQAQGLPAEIKTPSDENPYIESKYSNLKFLILFMNCNDENKNCKTLQFYMGYNDAKETTLEELNSWNRDKRFARAYRDNEGDPVLEMDVDLDFNGIPRENVGEAVNTWKSLMDAFQKHIHE
jgi:Putative bacterial sensory transduction regulator